MALTLRGSSSFTQCGPARWAPGRLNELDAMEVPYSGPYSAIDAFRNTLTRWSASTIDKNLFLETWPDDGGKHWPIVSLRFIGCKSDSGGNPILPAPIPDQGSTLQTASTSEGETEVSVLYESPHTSYSWISQNEGRKANGDIEYSGLSNPRPIVVKERRINGHLPGELTLAGVASYYLALAQIRNLSQADYDALKALVDARLAAEQPFIVQAGALRAAYFNYLFPESEQVTDFQAKVIVPGKYWLCSSVTSKVLQPN